MSRNSTSNSSLAGCLRDSPALLSAPALGSVRPEALPRTNRNTRRHKAKRSGRCAPGAQRAQGREEQLTRRGANEHRSSRAEETARGGGNNTRRLPGLRRRGARGGTRPGQQIGPERIPSQRTPPAPRLPPAAGAPVPAARSGPPAPGPPLPARPLLLVLQGRKPLPPLPLLLRRRLGYQLGLVSVVAAGEGEGRVSAGGGRCGARRGRPVGTC